MFVQHRNSVSSLKQAMALGFGAHTINNANLGGGQQSVRTVVNKNQQHLTTMGLKGTAHWDNSTSVSTRANNTARKKKILAIETNSS